MRKAEIRKLFGKNYLGLAELQPFFDKIRLDVSNITEQDIDFSDSVLNQAVKDGYVLIYGIESVDDIRITLRFLRDTFGVDPASSEPCFYNQDWYMHEDFMDISLKSKWYLIKKEVFEDSRAVMPVDLIDRGVVFPPAILCAYTFLAYYYLNNEFLWYHDFVWCQDVDHNGDRIYVGKYHDIDGVNKNGFSIHRHLSLRQCYGALSIVK